MPSLNSPSYQHTAVSGETLDLPLGKVVCVGRNYLDHVQELGNQVPPRAVLFIKPSTAVCDMRQDIMIPMDRGECHNELELAFLIGETLTDASEEDVAQAIIGVGLALDLTLRDEQTQLKKAGEPWERAKAFDRSCPLSPFITSGPILASQCSNPAKPLHFTLNVNAENIQEGDSSLMLRSLISLIQEISGIFTLVPGDVVLTGTPKGVRALHEGDVIEASLGDALVVNTRVKSIHKSPSA